MKWCIMTYIVQQVLLDMVFTQLIYTAARERQELECVSTHHPPPPSAYITLPYITLPNIALP